MLSCVCVLMCICVLVCVGVGLSVSWQCNMLIKWRPQTLSWHYCFPALHSCWNVCQVTSINLATTTSHLTDHDSHPVGLQLCVLHHHISFFDTISCFMCHACTCFHVCVGLCLCKPSYITVAEVKLNACKKYRDKCTRF